jgi:hypothetical protein
VAGTIFGLGLSQRIGSNGKPLSACKLYLFQANTTTPVTAYKNFGLTVGQEHAHPIEADAFGMIPEFWLADGDYRARLTDKSGVVIFDVLNVKALGPSAGGGGGGDTTDPNSILSTGDMKWRPSTGTLAGWVRANARTIGSAVSGASERANADCQALFEYLWSTFSDAICPVVGGRGASANADWQANKQITTIDMRGRVPAGVDDMGNTAASRITSATITNPTSGGASGGLQSHMLSSGESGQKAISSAPVSIFDPGHVHTGIRQYTGNFFDGGGFLGRQTEQLISSDPNTTGITASFTLAGSSATQPHNNMQPTLLGAWFIRL